MNRYIEISEYTAKELDIFARDTENMLAHYYEPHGGLFIAESPKVIERALAAGFMPEAMLLESGLSAQEQGPEGQSERETMLLESGLRTQEQGQDGQSEPAALMSGILKQLDEMEQEIPIYTAKLPVLEKITGYKLTRGALCAMHRRKLPELKELLENGKISRIAVIDNVENPTNVGAIFRSAAAMGMDAVLLTGDSSDPLYRRAIRVSMGTVFQIPWTIIEREEYTQLKEKGFRLAAMALKEDSVSLDDPALCAEKKLAVLMGNEGDGLTNETIEVCDYTVMIPMYHGVDSLNVAAASAVAFWQLGRRRQKC